MDVILPNGRLITGVPDNVTQKELAEIAINGNIASFEDFGDLFVDQTDQPEGVDYYAGVPVEMGRQGCRQGLWFWPCFLPALA